MKKYIYKNIMIISAILLLVIVLSLIFVVDFTAKERENYSSIVQAKTNSILEQANNIVDKGLEDIENFNYLEDPLPQNYFAYTVIEENNNENQNITLYKKEENISCTLKEGAYSKLSQNSFNILLKESLFLYYPENNPSYLCFSKTENNKTIILFKLAENIFNDDFIFDFDNIMIITLNGLVLTDYHSSITGAALYLDHYFSQEIQDVLNNNTGVFHADFLNNNRLFAFNKFENQSYKIITYLDTGKEDEFINTSVKRLILLIIFIILLASILSLLLILAYINYFNELFKLKFSKKLYIVYLDNKGKIKKSNLKYKLEFGKTDIFDNLFTTEFTPIKILHNNLPVVSNLQNKRKENKYVIFFSYNTSKGYKLVGEDATPILDEYVQNIKELRYNKKLNIFNIKQLKYDYNKAKKIFRTEDGLYSLLEIRNISNYKSMFGQEFYDSMVEKFAELFKKHLSEYGNIYYIGNESFILLITNSDKVQNFKDNIQNLIKLFNKPIQVEKSLIKVDCVASAVDIKGDIKTKTYEEINSLAEYTLERAYKIKKYYDIYDGSRNKFYLSYNRKKDLVKHIIENNLIEVHFQPQYSLRKNKIVAFEALIRITGKYKNEIEILELIEIAERTGLMITLGDYVFKKAFEFAKLIENYNVSISLNVSPVQLLQTGFAENFLEKYNSYELKRGSISVEITETFIMTSFNEMVSKLQILRDNGINIHLDDFGVAYSSMLYLKKLPISTIKIDKVFVDDIINNKHSKVICSKIIELANDLGLSSIAEGVENAEQMVCLKNLGCSIIQGFYIDKALSQDKAIAKLKG